MSIRPGLRDFFWMAAGALPVLAITIFVLYFQKAPDPSLQLASKDRRIQVVEEMRISLTAASELEKSAVMATTDEASQSFADQARAATAVVEAGRSKLKPLLEADGTKGEGELLDRFSHAFAELNVIDQNLLELATKNTNLKAYSLAFGPAADTLREMDAALSRILTESARSDSPKIRQATLLASRAQSGALRIQALLPPHIGEESDQKMDDLEAQMAREDQEVRKSLNGLAGIFRGEGNKDLEVATSHYAAFTELRDQILRLSRENTNVRSLTISLNQKRTAFSLCQDALTALEQAIQNEPVANYTPQLPR
jgi:hypothetical protein